MNEDFIKTAELVKALIIDQKTQLQLYGLYKQSTQGDVNISEPLDPVSYTKYQSWLLHKGKSSEQAQNEYIELVKSFNAGWGIGVSRPQYEEIEEAPLLPQEAQIKALCDSVKQGSIDPEILSVVGINCQDREGMTPLHHAVDEENIEMVNKIIECGANPNLRDSEGMTPLHYAVENDYDEILMALLKVPGVDLSLSDNDGKTVLEIAQGKCLKLL